MAGEPLAARDMLRHGSTSESAPQPLDRPLQMQAPPPASLRSDSPITTGGIVDCRTLSVGQLFDGRYRFTLPCFQRAYSWDASHVEQLIRDIRQSMAANKRYCLGRVMLAGDGGLDAEIIDGHQRLLTLTMLFAVLRDAEDYAEWIDDLDALVTDLSAPALSAPRYHLAIQSLPAPLFAELVQERGGTQKAPNREGDTLSETERNIIDCRDALALLVAPDQMDSTTRRAFARHLVQNCYVIMTMASDAKEAWDLVAIEQRTRLQFSEADEAKSVLLAATTGEDRAECGRIWESCEASLSSTDMFRLLGHIRAMSWRGRSNGCVPVESEIVARCGSAPSIVHFMRSELQPHAKRLESLRSGKIGHTEAAAAQIAESVARMTWLEWHTWVPAALYWLSERGEDHPETAAFFDKLERLTWVLKIAGVDPGVQETRILRLLDDVKSAKPVADLEQLKIEPSLKTELVASLRRQNFAAKHYAGPVLRRISLALGPDPGPLHRDKVTIEHIFPSNPLKSSNWRRVLKSNDEIRLWSQRLGNVTFLSGSDNQKAGTRDWDFKRGIYRVSNFELSRDAARESEWTTSTIKSRTERLIAMLFDVWGLGPAGR